MQLKLGSFLSVTLLLAVSKVYARNTIVNGRPAGNGYPFVGILRNMNGMQGDSGAQFCTCSLIAPTLVITAAHCLVDKNPTNIMAVFNKAVLSEQGGLRSQAKQIYINPNNVRAINGLVNTAQLGIDVALLELQTPINMNRYLTLAYQNLAQVGSTVQAIGYGLTNMNGGLALSNQVLTAFLKLQDPSRCGIYNEANKYILCGLVSEGGTCNGDSGSPLLMTVNEQPFIVGILSAGQGRCGQPGSNNVYTNVALTRGWIVPSLVKAAITQGKFSFTAGENFKNSVRMTIKSTGGLELKDRVFDLSQSNGWTGATQILSYTGNLDDTVSVMVEVTNGVMTEYQQLALQF